MLIGIIGAPNKGKSTLFSALTLNDVTIADYPFTTIDPNKGVAYATRECVERELNVKCNARNSLCVNGTRMLPINVVDVAGLVEGAHEGRGMGNQFLNDLSAADCFIIVVDASGKTDKEGNRCESCNPVEDVNMVKGELAEWIASIVKKHMSLLERRRDGIDALHELFTSFKITREQVEKAINDNMLISENIRWSEEETRKFSTSLLEASKPMVIAANKCDVEGAEKNIAKLKAEFGEANVIGCSAAIELALKKAARSGAIDYVPGSRSFNIIGNVNDEQRRALEYMLEFVKKSGTNVQQLINYAAFGLLDNIVVYPVEDENKYTDHFGNVLPDALLVRRGTTAIEFAEMIHTDLAKGMLYAVDAKKKIRIPKDYALKDNDVIRIVSAKH
ncbi:MAG: redox-regulated ATPase YchF [Candidatus Micrarchaeia archaeon]